MRSGYILLSTAAEERAAPYLEALTQAGLQAERLRVVTPEAPANGLEIAGLVLCGGADVAPSLYGEATLPEAGVEIVPQRDAAEWALLAATQEARRPVWGVCRGLQVLNVFLGGSLWQDLPSQRPSPVEHSLKEPPDLLAHAVRLTAPDAPIAARLGGEPALVNSRHHQAVKRLAPRLLPVAESPDGLIEAFVLEDPEWWVRAVQWHPENLTALAPQRALWTDFVEAVGR